MHDSIPEKFLGKVHFVPNIPDALIGLHELSRNLWWTWNPRARELFRLIDLKTWISTKGNAVRFLRNVPQTRLDEAAADKRLLKNYADVMDAFGRYKTGEQSWWRLTHQEKSEDTLIAYFSAEYGLHETLQTYSGGLGVLSGDHCKSASDLGIPLVAVGLIYRDGYFQQYLDSNGQQVAIYQRQKWEELPVNEVFDREGHEIRIQIDLPGRLVTAKVWRINVGRIPIYMLDTDIAANTEADRQLTSRLYGGDQETRIQQEILLGMGGVKALRALRSAGLIDRDPTLYHMNEGHSAFLSLERLKSYLQHDNLTISEATEVIRASSLFTTHTPVPAGHDRFPVPLIEKYFRSYYESALISRSEFLDFGIEPMPDGQQLFSMTILALHFAAMANGVSQLHGDVSKKMMAPIWRDVPPSETPIGYITNGVHTRTWMSFDMQNLFDKHMGVGWRDNIVEESMWTEFVEKVSDAEIWGTMGELKKTLVRFIHDRLKLQHARFGDLPDQLEQLDSIFIPDALTIGFARRFATYKRATLIFRDPARLARIINNPARPIKLVFAGKAHPADRPGQDFIRRIVEFSKLPEFHNRLVFLENYDMNIGRRLTSGVDVWLNSPRRPYEASGTSGMKVPLNGGLNFSILDGWWPEAMRKNPDVGWAIGSEKEYATEEQQDAEDAENLYRTLEKQIAPLYYDRGEDGIPHGWIKRVKESMRTCGPIFSTDRMVSEYTEKYYIRGAERHHELMAENYAAARSYAKKKAELRKNWSHIRVNARVLSDIPAGGEMYSVPVKNEIGVIAEVHLGAVSRNEVKVEIYAEDLRTVNGDLPTTISQPMTYQKEEVIDGQNTSIYRGSFVMNESGEHGFTVRVIPNDPKLFHPQELGLVRWAQG
ncbi:glycosyltransferase family 1 protein [soil metagenome]